MNWVQKVQANMRLTQLICVFVGASLSHPAISEIDQKVMRDPTVRVGCKTRNSFSQGSGFLVGSDGRYVLTNAHVIDQCVDSPLVLLSHTTANETSVFRSKVDWSSSKDVNKQHLDAALLKLDQEPKRSGVRFALSPTAKEGDRVWAMGFPGSADKIASSDSFASPTGSSGTISRIVTWDYQNGRRVGVKLYQVTAAMNPGSSGGPLFNEFGEVIGINTLKSLVNAVIVDSSSTYPQIKRVPEGEGIGWAQQIDELLPLLRQRGIAFSGVRERRSDLWMWVEREPVGSTAIGATGAIALLWLGFLSFRLMRQQKFSALSARGNLPVVPNQRLDASGIVIGVKGDYRGSTFPVQGELVFGREAATCNIVFKGRHSEISGRHCSLRFDSTSNTFVLTDLHSSNGTFAEGRRLNDGEAITLRPGDKFHLSHLGIRFELATM